MSHPTNNTIRHEPSYKQHNKTCTYLLPVEYLHRYSISFYYISKLKKQSVPKLDSNSSVSQCHQMSILNVTMSPDEFLKCHNVTRLVSSMSPSHNMSIVCH